MGTIPLSGGTESNSGPKPCAPSTYYEYRVTTSNRTAKSIHVKVELWLRMGNYNSFFTYAISHDCWVRGGNSGSWKYAYTLPKWNRLFWGHQSSLGGYWYEVRNGWVIEQNQRWAQYDGRHWNGPFVVFDQDVPMGLDDSEIQVCPCITRPNIAYERLQVLHWYGQYGEWRPGMADKVNAGYWGRNQGHGASPEHAAFANNRYEQNLAGFRQPGKYPRPSVPTVTNLTPLRVDVAVQSTQQITAKWTGSKNTQSFIPYISLKKDHSDAVALPATPDTSLKFIPNKYLKRTMVDGDKVYFGVLAKDNAGVESTSIGWYSEPVVYYEVQSYAPDKARMVGRKKVNNELFFKGENTTIYYSGEVNGSYPIAKYEFVRVSDGAKVTWTPKDAKSVKGAIEKYLTKATPAVPRPNTDYVWELRAYNTNGKAVYMKNGKWLRVTIHYYGGTIYIYDNTKNWREGVAWIYCDDKKWHEAEAVYIYTLNGWKTL